MLLNKVSLSKKDMVKIAIRNGVTMPKEIAQYLKKHYGVTITAAYVSVIKGGLSRKEWLWEPAPKEKPEEKPVPVPQKQARGDIKLRVADISELLRISEKIGGPDNLARLVGMFAM